MPVTLLVLSLLNILRGSNLNLRGKRRENARPSLSQSAAPTIGLLLIEDPIGNLQEVPALIVLAYATIANEGDSYR